MPDVPLCFLVPLCPGGQNEAVDFWINFGLTFDLNSDKL